MSNLAVISEKALKNIPATATPAERLHIALKVLRTLRAAPENMTHRLAVALRASFKEALRGDMSEDSKLQIAAAVESLKEIDPRRLKRQGKRKDGSYDLLESCTRGDGIAAVESQTSDDPWDDNSNRTSDEFVRLNDVDRQFTTYASGQFILKPGADVKSFLLAVLDGREPTVETFAKLHKYIAGRGGPLCAEVSRILRERGVLPPIDPAAKTYNELLLEELETRA